MGNPSGYPMLFGRNRHVDRAELSAQLAVVEHHAAVDERDAAGSTSGAEPQMGHLSSVVALIWRSVVLWMLLLALLSLANLVG